MSKTLHEVRDSIGNAWGQAEIEIDKKITA